MTIEFYYRGSGLVANNGSDMYFVRGDGQVWRETYSLKEEQGEGGVFQRKVQPCPELDWCVSRLKDVQEEAGSLVKEKTVPSEKHKSFPARPLRDVICLLALALGLAVLVGGDAATNVGIGTGVLIVYGAYHARKAFRGIK